MAWFRREHESLPPTEQESRVPEGLYVKCGACKESIYRKEVLKNLSVCPKCAFHFRISARERLTLLCDFPWDEFDDDLASSDPLRWLAPSRNGKTIAAAPASALLAAHGSR